MLEKLFKLGEHNTSVRTEVIAGLTTFLTMSYIIFVNPDILSSTGMDRNAVFVATCLAAAVGSLIMGLVASYGYLFDAASLYGVSYDTTMSLPTAICLVVLSLGSLLAEPRGALQWIFYGRDPGAALQRLLIPLTVIVLPVAGLVLYDGQRSDRFGLAFAWALLIVITVGVVIAIGLGAGQVARSIDDDRERLLAELHQANQELEDRVRMRSHQLNRQRTKLVLLEERDRIEGESAEFHERVRAMFLRLAAAEPDRYLVVDARRPVEEIERLVRERVEPLLGQAVRRGAQPATDARGGQQR